MKITTPQLTDADLAQGHCYSAKQVQRIGFIRPLLNDRQILHVDPVGRMLQYDSPTVGFGRHYPRVTFDAFLRWARADVTDQMPPDNEWRPAP